VIVCVAWALVGDASAAVARASSEGTGDEDVRYVAGNAFDGLLATAWAEGVSGNGDGSWIELKFDKPIDVTSVSLWPGWLGGSNREIREYGRPKVVTVTLDTAAGPVTAEARLLDPGSRGPIRHDVAVEAKQARGVKITLDEAYTGGIYSDTFIAEVGVNFVSGATPPAVQAVETWHTSEAGQKVADAHRLKAIALFDQVNANEFGDSDALHQLMDWAGDGAPYLRERARSVPLGFKMSAILPDKTSVEALLKLKDSNAIPAIERASIRTTGPLSEDLARRAKMFDAYRELLGGTNRIAPPWGTTGIGKGALQGLGEPLDIVIDDVGRIYVADVANNRVQQYDIEQGVQKRAWGTPEAGIVEDWFYRTRDAYAAASLPGTEPGQFTQPIDLALLPTGQGQDLLVLDAKGRVTRIASTGELAGTTTVKVDGQVGPGGDGHILVSKGQVVVILGNEGVLLSPNDWTEKARFTLPDGSPRSATVLKNGKLALAFGDTLLRYSSDGFREGDILGDALGGGFQDWSVTTDEYGALWAVLDTGEAVKFKKPGKVEFRIKIAPYSIEAPRMAVIDDHLFVTSKDKILRVDALEVLERGTEDKAAGTLDIDEP
jgi:hypothetical protein